MPRINYTVEQLRDKAVDVRRNVVTMGATGGWGGIGSSLAAADLMTTLFFYEVNFNPDDLEWPERDLWHVSSKGLTAALYATMAEVGYFPKADLLAVDQPDNHIEGFPSARTPGIELSGGVQGAGLSGAVGMGLATRMHEVHRRVYCVVDDSEVQDGQFWEAALAAAQFELEQLVLVVDYDDKQADGDVEDVMALAPLNDKLRSFNWHTLEIDGNDMEAVVGGLDRSRSNKGAPTAILNCSMLGKGVSFMESEDPWYAGIPTEEQAVEALSELGTTLEEWRKRLTA